jgi:hypothetical protein
MERKDPWTDGEARRLSCSRQQTGQASRHGRSLWLIHLGSCVNLFPSLSLHSPISYMPLVIFRGLPQVIISTGRKPEGVSQLLGRSREPPLLTSMLAWQPTGRTLAWVLSPRVQQYPDSQNCECQRLMVIQKYRETASRLVASHR